MTYLKCDRCLPAKCCTYVSFEIDKPEELSDYENLLWYVAHTGVELYIHKKSWYMNVLNRCEFLGADNRCTAYERRPQICREYSLEECEYEANQDAYEYEEYFKNFSELENYVWKKYGKRFVKDSPRPVGLKLKTNKRIYPQK